MKTHKYTCLPDLIAESNKSNVTILQDLIDKKILSIGVIICYPGLKGIICAKV
jgi:hypothetical protein